MWKALLKYGIDIALVMNARLCFGERKKLPKSSSFFLHISRGLDQKRGLYSLAVLPSQHSHCDGRQLKSVTEAQKWHRYETRFFCSFPLSRTSHMDERGLQRGLGNCWSMDIWKEVYLKSNLFIFTLGCEGCLL